MPCHIPLSSVLESRALHRAIWPVAGGLGRLRRFHAYAPALQQQPPLSRLVETTEITAHEEEKRRRALERLDGVVDPNDLSATLEAHRDSNRAAMIKKVQTDYEDLDVVRPSFLNEIPRTKITRNPMGPRKVNERRREDTKKTANELLSDMFQLGRKGSAEQKTGEARANQKEMHGRRMNFLQKHERPRGVIDYGISRWTFFDAIRRVRKIVQSKQHRIRTETRILEAPTDLLEYEGRRVAPKTSPQDPLVLEPWARRPEAESYTRPERQAHGSALDIYQVANERNSFESEVDAFAKWMEPTPGEEAARAAVFKNVLSLIQKIAPQIQSEKFGSQATGLAMPMSDVDIRLYPKDFDLHLNRNPDLNTNEAKKFLRSMHAVHKVLKDHKDFTLVMFLYGRYPLISATHAPSGLTVQLVATPDTSPSRDCMKAYLGEYPTLKPLYMVIKTMLDMRGLTDVWYGGLGSYSIFMMVVASLKHKSKPSDTISKQLLDFMDFFSSLDTHKYCVGVEPAQLFKKKSIPSLPEQEVAKDDLVSETPAI